MSLNSYRDEVRNFLEKINALNEGPKKKVEWLEEEFQLLKQFIEKNQQDKIKHQIYDMMFLLFEISVDYEFNLDEEWNIGRENKQKKYIQKNT